MPPRKPVASDLDDLSYATVAGSRFFGLTNVTGKVLAALSLVSLGVMIFVGAQFVWGPGDIAAALPMGIGAFVVSMTSGLAGYWFGNFDDRTIIHHNARVRRPFKAGHAKIYEGIEDKFVKSLARVDYDPFEKSLPYDALGHAVHLPDDKIDLLPAHIQLDIYRTQADLEFFIHAGLTSCRTREGKSEVDEIVNSLKPLEDMASAYKDFRDRAAEDLIESGVEFTPLHPERPPGRRSWLGRLGGIIADYEPSGDIYIPRGRWRLSGSGAGGSTGSFGGGDFGSGGGIGGGGFTTGGVMEGSGGSFSTGGGFGAPSGRSDNRGAGDALKGAGAALVIIIAAALIAAATVVVARALKKNFWDKAEKPAFGDVHIAYLAHSLKSSESKIRRMYASS